MLLAGHRILVTGLLNERSIAYATARLALEQGAQVAVTGFGRTLSITRQFAQRLAADCPVLELDVTNPDHLTEAAAWCGNEWGRVDGVLHSVAFAPDTALDGNFLRASWPDVSTALHVSTYSFAAMARAFAPLLARSAHGSLVGLDFDADMAWPGYDWMGVAKAGLESCCRYLAMELGAAGTRVNLVAAGPLRTIAASSLDSFAGFERAWRERAPLGWDVRDAEPVARTVCALWSSWLPATTGEVVHVDGGAHAVGGSMRPPAGAEDGAAPVGRAAR